MNCADVLTEQVPVAAGLARKANSAGETAKSPELPEDCIAVSSPVTGSIWQISVAAGKRVQVGEELIVVEAMKMEIPITATSAGKIKAILVKLDDVLAEGQVVAILDA